ncbi:MAG: hypothetical protein JSV90_03430 [Methanobacteriota archaeon]|nr:MAG: hypothetical protein JSV90_03430 [Euryarchaeota archaeon]
MNVRVVPISVVIITALVLVLTPAFRLATISSAQDEEIVLRIGLLGEIDSLNPFIGMNDSARIFFGLVYDNLISLDEDLKPKPNLATDWCIVDEYEPYGSVWQYNLTQNAYWHDGEKLDADDVVFTFEYQIGDKWVAMWMHQPYTILIQSVEKVDDYAVRLHFARDGEPTACSFGDSLMIPIVPEHYWRDINYIDAGFSHTNPQPIGSGPFKCTEQTYTEFLEGEGITLQTHYDYHGEPEYGDDVKFDALVLNPYPEHTDLLEDFKEGAIDLAQFDSTTYSALLDWLDENPSEEILANAVPKCTGLSAEISVCMLPDSWGNLLRLDPAVRLALAHGTDKQSTIEQIYGGYAEIGSTLIAPVFPDWHWEPEGEEVAEYDIDLANETLDNAGYLWDYQHTTRYAPEGHPWNPTAYDTPLEFDLIVDQSIAEDHAVALFLAEEYAKIGIDVNPVYVDTALWGAIVYGGTYDLALTRWSGDPDPNYLLFTQTTDALGGWSETWYSNPENDENYSASVLETNREERRIYVESCQRHMYRDNAFIVYAYPQELCAWRTDTFTGWGDWEAHPGRAISNHWTANDLYFDLMPFDVSPPNTTADIVGTMGKNGWYQSNVTVALHASDDSGSVDGTQFSLDESDWAAYENPVKIAGDGLHTLEFYSIDYAGNCELHKTLEVAIDTNGPSVLIDLEDGTVFTADAINISWISSDTGSGVDHTEFSVDGGTYTPCEDCYVVLTNMSDGEHSLEVRVHDEAGNNASDTLQFEVDPPDGGISGMSLVIIISAAAVVAVAAIVYLMLRRTHESPPPQ